MEELVLGLQAYRRLDITANCLARNRYREITNGFETGAQCEGDPCLCSGRYKGTGQWHFDVGCDAVCGTYYTPQTDGYSGFFLREDATQALADVLHDSSDGKWNIDLVGGNGYSTSLSPPCVIPFSQPCCLVHRQGFMSQDGVFALMIGLTMIKRFIPPYAKVTTCEGQDFYPLDMAIKIASNMTNRIDNEYLSRISWPGSNICCDEEVFISGEAGGHLDWTMHGLKKVCTYIDGVERHSDIWEGVLWGGFAAQSAGFWWGDNARHYVRLKALGWDMGGAGNGGNYMAAMDDKNLEIMRFVNNLLYPAPPNMGIDKEYFKKMLCSAPCGGPCRKRRDYPDSNEWPQYECANDPNWPGQRWEHHGVGKSDANRQFNGLDFMALYNFYLLYFPEERTAYFNPDRPGGNITLGSGSIDGPAALCPDDDPNNLGDMGQYNLLYPQPSAVQDLIWTTSANLTVTSTHGLSAHVQANSVIYTPAFIQATFKEKHEIAQNYDGSPHYWTRGISGPLIHHYGNLADVCEMAYRKPIYSATPQYEITAELNHCQGIYEFHAISTSPDLPGSTYTWSIEMHPAVGTISTVGLTGKDPHVEQWQWLPEQSGYLIIKLAVTTPCGNTEATAFGITYECKPEHQLTVKPNPSPPSKDRPVEISIDECKDEVGKDGLLVSFIPAKTSEAYKSDRIYRNCQSISIADLPAGDYIVQVALPDKTMLTTTLVVSGK